MKIEKTYHSKVSLEDFYSAWISTESCIDPVFKIECDAKPGGKLILHSKSNQGSIKDDRSIY